jgi:hypothetical protein
MLEKLDIGNEKVLAYRASGEVTRDDMKTMEPEMDRTIQENGRANLLLEMKDYKNITVRGLLEETRMLPKMNNIDRVAVVGDSGIQKNMAEITDFIGKASETEVKYFDKRDEAADWVNQK